MRLLLGIPTDKILLNNLLAIHFIILKTFLYSVLESSCSHVLLTFLEYARMIFKCERHTPGDVWHVVVSVSVWSSNVNGTLLVMFGMLLSVYPCDLQTWTAHSWWCCGMLLSVYPWMIFKRERHTPGDVWHVAVCVSVWSSNVNGTLLVMFGMLLSVYPCDLQTWTAHSWWCLACCCLYIRVIFKCERHTPGDVWHVVVCISVWSSNVNGTLLVMFGMLLSVYPCDLQTWTAHSWWCVACCCLYIRVIFKRERHTPGDVWHVVVCVSVWSSNVNGTLLVMCGMLLSVYPCDLQTWTVHSWWCVACCCQCIREWSSNVNGTLLVMFGMLLSVYPCDFKRERHTPGDVWHVVVSVSVWLQTWTAHSWWCLACCCQCIRETSNVNGTLLVMFGMLLSVYPCDFL